MAVDGSLIFDTKIDTKNFTKGTNTIKSQANSLKSTFLSLGKIIASTFIIKKSIDLGKQALELSSDLEEVQNVVDVAFGEMSYKIEEFAKTSIEKFGMSKLAAKDTASSFMAMAKGMQLPSEAASDMALQLTALSADMASFFNIAQSEARTALASVYTGETETLKRYGILMTEVNLQEYARQQGIEKSISAMTQQEKVLLRYNYVMNATRLSQGDFARTSESWANQTRILKEQWKEFLAVLGQGLIQVLAPVVRFLSTAMNYMMALARAVNEVMASVFGFNMNLIDSTSGVSSGAEEAAGNITELGDAAEEAGKKAAKAVAPFDKLNEVASAEVTGNPLQAIDSFNPEGAIEAGGAIGAVSKNIDKMDSKIKKMAAEIKPVLQGIVDVFDKFAPAIAGIAAAFITHKVVDWFSKLAGAIGAFSLGPAGIIAIAIGALVAIGLALKKLRDDAIEADLEKRFGEIYLSLEDIEEIAGRLTDSSYSANIDVYVNEEQKLSELEQNIETDIETLNKLNWKISVGMELTPDEVSAYSATIDKFVTDTNAYIEQQHYVASLAIDVIAPDDASFNAEMKKLIDEYYSGTKGDMAQLGKDLRSAMDEAVADGVIDEAEQKVINNLIGEINEITSRVADAKFLAKLQGITVEGELSPESFKDLNKRIQEIIQERIDVADEAAYTTRANINAAYTVKMEDATTQAEKDAIQKEWDGTLQEITDNLSNTKAEITFSGTTFATDKLYEKYESELTAMGANIKGFTRETFSKEFLNGLKEVDPNRAVTDFMSVVEGDYQMAWELSGMDGISAEGLKQMLAELKPTAEQNKELYDWYIETGKIPPKALTDQMTAYGTLEALTGQSGVDGMYYAIGQQMADSPEILKMIANGEIAGGLLDDALIRGMKSKIPDLQKQGNDIVFNVDKAVETASKNAGKSSMPNYSKEIIKGYNSGFDKDTSAKKSVRGWLDGINDTIKNYKMNAVKVRAEFFGLELPGITGSNQNFLRYPQYATGNVIPANYGNFLATLGDNKREPEVVSPLSTMKQAMKEAMAEMGGVGGEYTFIAQLDGKTLFKETVNQDQMQRKVTGKSAFAQ